MASAKVYLVGAGPGDPGLITVRGLECVRAADVILYDRLVGPEILREARPDAELVYCGKRPGHETLSQRKPWLIAFGFGLVHGFGFAGALAEIGLPKGAEVLALLLFNLGVEIGQVAFVGAVLLLVFLATRLARLPLVPARMVAAYAIGITGAYWAIERIINVFV